MHLTQLPLLDRIFSAILIPPAVFQEITLFYKPHSHTLSQFALNKINPVKNQLAVQSLTQVIDPGEAEAIVLALENGIQDLLIDDAKGRRIARLNGLAPLGTIGILLRAKQLGYITEIKSSLDTLIVHQIRISKGLYNQALKLAQENE